MADRVMVVLHRLAGRHAEKSSVMLAIRSVKAPVGWDVAMLYTAASTACHTMHGASEIPLHRHHEAATMTIRMFKAAE